MILPFTSDELFWGGIAIMALTVFLMLLFSLCFRVTGKRLRKHLEKEYGKRQR